MTGQVRRSLPRKSPVAMLAATSAFALAVNRDHSADQINLAIAVAVAVAKR